MEMVKSVDIGAITYAVHCSEEGIDKARTAEREPKLAGCIFYEQCWIALDPTLPESKKREVLLHEITHGIIHNSDMTIGKNKEEEHFIRLFSRGMLDTLRRNPQLVTFLMGDA